VKAPAVRDLAKLHVAGVYARVDQSKVSELQTSDLLDIDPDALREAERVFAQGILDTMAGKQVLRAIYEDTRVVVVMSDGSEYYFYGFMGESRSH
jgi:hypothetical protein